jgi:hypothetical protein
MAGGLLNIVAIGANNVFLTGNPCKTFFKATYAKYSNFGFGVNILLLVVEY